MIAIAPASTRRSPQVPRWMHCALGVLAVIAGGALEAGAQQPAGAPTGTVIGQVVNAETKAPLPAATVLVTGTLLRDSTNGEGRFVVREVPAGTHTLRVRFLGFGPQEQSVTLAGGDTATVNFALQAVPYVLTPFVVTALGLERKERSLGYAVQSINTGTLEKVPETTMMQGLAGQSPGVQVTSASGRPGAGARMTIRGEASFSGRDRKSVV